MITDHKPLVVIFKKDIASLSHRLQRMVLRILQYNIGIQYKPFPQLLITDWLSRQSYETDRDDKIPGMYITISAIESYMDILDFIRAKATSLHLTW